MVKSITHQTTGKTVKMGCNPPPVKGPRFKLKNYLLASIPAPPDTLNYDGPAWPSLTDIMGNDVAGDCVEAGMFHTEGILTGNAGKLFVPSLDQVFALYSTLEGPPGYPASDNGTDPVVAMNYWQQTGLMGDGTRKIAHWMVIDGTNALECRTALWLFENLGLAMDLPNAWVNPFPSADGFVWAVEGDPDPSNGHYVPATGYSPHSFRIATWGMWGMITDQAVAKYTAGRFGGDLYCVISHDGISKATGKCPAGVDWSQLQADFDSVG